MLQTQTNTSQSRFAVGQEVQHLWKDVRQHASLGDALADAQAEPRVRRLRQTLLKTVASARPPKIAHR